MIWVKPFIFFSVCRWSLWFFSLNRALLLRLPLWFTRGFGLFEVLFLFDSVSLLFSSILLTIVRVIYYFSKSYMDGDLLQERFNWVLLTFILSMLVLILSSNLFFLLLGWDGLGITRFILICFYPASSSWRARLKTVLINRLGDRLLIVSLLAFCLRGGLNLFLLNKIMGKGGWLILILALITKRAQFPFRAWLPAAMAAPTPVSALVHSSTLVTAGIYVLVRIAPIMSKTRFILLGYIGLWTLLIASFAACLERDIKKIIAFSTLRQLGLMVFALRQGFINLCLLHLVRHAIFKANMFMCAGYYLMGNRHAQDLRGITIMKSRGIIDLSLLVCVLNLKGIAYLTGFFSKDNILEGRLGVWNGLIWLLFISSLLFTTVYSFRVFSLLFNFNRRKSYALKRRGINRYKLVPVFLALFSLVLGWSLSTNFFLCSKACRRLKGFIPVLFILGLIPFLFAYFPSYQKHSFIKRIGGLDFFNGIGIIKYMRKAGLFTYETADKGLFSFMIKKKYTQVIQLGRNIWKNLGASLLFRILCLSVTLFFLWLSLFNINQSWKLVVGFSTRKSLV